MLGVGLFCPSGAGTPTTGVLDIPRAACRPNKRAVPVFGAGLLQYKSSSRPAVQNRAHLSGVGSSVGQRRAAIRRALLLCRETRPALRAAHAFAHSGNGVLNVAAGCDRGSTRDEIRQQLQSSYNAPSDIRRCAAECRIDCRSGSARDGLSRTSRGECPSAD